MATVTRARRAEIQHQARTIRMRCQREQHTIERTVTEIRTALPEVTALEAWRLALGWSRAQTVVQVGALYVATGLRLRGLTDSMLCRWEHDPAEWPDAEYTVMLSRAYGARPEQLGLGRFRTASEAIIFRYGQAHTAADDGHDPHEMEPMRMTTDAGLPAVRESLHLTLLASPEGGPLVADLAEAVVEHYALNYSKHPPNTLFEQVRDVRQLLTPALESRSADDDIRRQVGWLSALLGNLAYHLDDISGARTHLTTAVAYGTRTGDRRLEAWAWGAQSMVARTSGRITAAMEHAERGVAAAPHGLVRAQLHAWALLPALAAAGRDDDAERALTTAMNELDSATETEAPRPVRFRSGRTRPPPSRGVPRSRPGERRPDPCRVLDGRMYQRHPRLGGRITGTRTGRSARRPAGRGSAGTRRPRPRPGHPAPVHRAHPALTPDRHARRPTRHGSRRPCRTATDTAPADRRSGAGTHRLTQ